MHGTQDFKAFERYLYTRYHLDSADAEPVVSALQRAIRRPVRRELSTEKSLGAKVIVFPIRNAERAQSR